MTFQVVWSLSTAARHRAVFSEVARQCTTRERFRHEHIADSGDGVSHTMTFSEGTGFSSCYDECWFGCSGLHGIRGKHLDGMRVFSAGL